MDSDASRPQTLQSVAGRFTTTHWSVVLQAGQEHSPESAAALETLCRTYWYPLYAFVRREGHNPEAAADLTQEFFSRLLATNGLATVNRSKGRFRSFLLATMKHLLANEWQHAHRQKRGGGRPHFSLDAVSAEDRYQCDPADPLTPEKIFERRWAETVIDAVTRRLQAEFAEAGLARRFEVLKMFLLADEEPISYADTARRLDVTEGAVRSAIHRMRRRYGELFRAEIAQTVTGPSEIEAELRHLLAVLGSEA
jgi:RNA polymerase sigma factor (sigma-70 family)